MKKEKKEKKEKNQGEGIGKYFQGVEQNPRGHFEPASMKACASFGTPRSHAKLQIRTASRVVVHKKYCKVWLDFFFFIYDWCTISPRHSGSDSSEASVHPKWVEGARNLRFERGGSFFFCELSFLKLYMEDRLRGKPAGCWQGSLSSSRARF